MILLPESLDAPAARGRASNISVIGGSSLWDLPGESVVSTWWYLGLLDSPLVAVSHGGEVRITTAVEEEGNDAWRKGSKLPGATTKIICHLYDDRGREHRVVTVLELGVVFQPLERPNGVRPSLQGRGMVLHEVRNDEIDGQVAGGQHLNPVTLCGRYGVFNHSQISEIRYAARSTIVYMVCQLLIGWIMAGHSGE